jgi:hypothetical protein
MLGFCAGNIRCTRSHQAAFTWMRACSRRSHVKYCAGDCSICDSETSTVMAIARRSMSRTQLPPEAILRTSAVQLEAALKKTHRA